IPPRLWPIRCTGRPEAARAASMVTKRRSAMTSRQSALRPTRQRSGRVAEQGPRPPGGAAPRLDGDEEALGDDVQAIRVTPHARELGAVADPGQPRVDLEEVPVAGEEARDEDHRAAGTPRHGAAVEEGGGA